MFFERLSLIVVLLYGESLAFVGICSLALVLVRRLVLTLLLSVILLRNQAINPLLNRFSHFHHHNPFLKRDHFLFKSCHLQALFRSFIFISFNLFAQNLYFQSLFVTLLLQCFQFSLSSLISGWFLSRCRSFRFIWSRVITWWTTALFDYVSL